MLSALFKLVACFSITALLAGCGERVQHADDFGRTFVSQNHPPPEEVVDVVELWRLKSKYSKGGGILPLTADLVFRAEGAQAKKQASIMNDVLVNNVLRNDDAADVVWIAGSKIAEKYVFAVTRNDGVRIRMKMTVLIKDGKTTEAEFITPSSSVYFIDANAVPRILALAK